MLFGASKSAAERDDCHQAVRRERPEGRVNLTLAAGPGSFRDIPGYSGNLAVQHCPPLSTVFPSVRPGPRCRRGSAAVGRRARTKWDLFATYSSSLLNPNQTLAPVHPEYIVIRYNNQAKSSHFPRRNLLPCGNPLQIRLPLRLDQGRSRAPSLIGERPAN
jgi:hypothetical protein